MNPFKSQHNHGYHRKKASFSQNKHLLAHPIGIALLLGVGFVFATLVANFFINMLNNLFFSNGSIFDNSDKINSEWTTYFFKFRFDLALFYIPFYIAYIILWGKKVYQIRQKFKSLNDQEKASGRFATKKEIKQQYKAIAQREEEFEGEGGLPVAMFGVYDFATKTKQYLEQRQTAKQDIDNMPNLTNEERNNLKQVKLGQINKDFAKTFFLKREFTFIDESPTNNLFVGTSRSGKGELFVLSMIENYSRSSHKPSLVINDMKGELYSASNDPLEDRNYHVEVFNLDQPMESTMSFNLLQLVIEEYQKGDLGEAQEMTKQITHTLTNNEGVEDNEWNLMSAALINAMILALCEEALPEHPEKVTLYSVSNMLQTLSVKKFYKQLQIGSQVKLIETSALDEYMEKFPSHSPAKTQYATVEAAPDKMRSSIIGTALKALQPFTTDTIAKLTSHSSLDLNKLGFPSIIDGFSAPDSTFDLGIQVKREGNQGLDYEEVEGIHIGVNEYGYWQYPFKTILNVGDRIEIVEKDEFNEEFKYYFYVNSIDSKGHITFEPKGDSDLSNVTIRKFNSFSKPIALFMVVPDYNSANHGIASILVNQIVFELSKNSQLYTENQSTHRRVVFHLDESGNMPQIPNLSQKVNVSLSRGLRFNFFVQAFSQIKDVYGDAYDAIMDACQNKVYIMATQEDTQKEFSSMIGNEQITVRSRSGETDSLKSSITENQEERPLLRYDELAHLKEGETVIVRNLKRQDKKRNKIMSYPIFNSGKYALKYRYQYLADLMDTNKSIIHYRPLLKERCEHRHLQLETTLVNWDKIIEDMQQGIESDETNTSNTTNNNQTNNPETYKEKGNKKPVTRQKKVLTLKEQLSEQDFDKLIRRFSKTIRLYEKDGGDIKKLTLYSLKRYLNVRVKNNEIDAEQNKNNVRYVEELIEEAKAK